MKYMKAIMKNALTEDIPPETTGYRGTTLIQAEEICNNYRKNWKLDLLILRLDHLFCIPESASEIHSVCPDVPGKYAGRMYQRRQQS